MEAKSPSNMVAKADPEAVAFAKKAAEESGFEEKLARQTFTVIRSEIRGAAPPTGEPLSAISRTDLAGRLAAQLQLTKFMRTNNDIRNWTAQKHLQLCKDELARTTLAAELKEAEPAKGDESDKALNARRFNIAKKSSARNRPRTTPLQRGNARASLQSKL